LTTYPSTSVLASDGTGASVLTPPSGFGDGFGDAFGGWQPTVTAVLDATPGTAVLATDGTSTAILADPGPSTALLIEVNALADLQLV
jgi:hypothetical protein